MTRTRQELGIELAALDLAVAELLDEHEDSGDFWPAFAGQADQIIDSAAPQDCQWVHEQLDLLMARYGLEEVDS